MAATRKTLNELYREYRLFPRMRKRIAREIEELKRRVNEATVTIGGYVYGIRFDDAGRVLETKCEGRWPWSASATGDPWLDGKLADAAKAWLAKGGDAK